MDSLQGRTGRSRAWPQVIGRHDRRIGGRFADRRPRGGRLAGGGSTRLSPPIGRDSARRFGDVEPLDNHSVGWLDTYVEFARAFQAQTSEHLSFLQADITWFDNWRPQLVEWRKQLRPAGLSYGIIFDGSRIDRSNLAWTSQAVERYRTVTRDPAVAPDDAVIQTWNDNPTRFLPETLTFVVTRTVSARQQ